VQLKVFLRICHNLGREHSSVLLRDQAKRVRVGEGEVLGRSGGRTRRSSTLAAARQGACPDSVSHGQWRGRHELGSGLTPALLLKVGTAVLVGGARGVAPACCPRGAGHLAARAWGADSLRRCASRRGGNANKPGTGRAVVAAAIAVEVTCFVTPAEGTSIDLDRNATVTVTAWTTATAAAAI